MTTLPLHMEPDPDDPELQLPYVDGTIDGRPYRFLLDTGAAQSRVATDAYLSTLALAGEKESKGVFGASLTDELVVLKTLSIGPIDKTDLTVVRSVGDERPSLVGMDVLGDMALAVDLDGAQLHFAPGGSLPTSWPLRRGPAGHPYLDLRFPGVVAHACWDTGSAATLVNTAFVEANPSLFTPAGASVGHDSTGATQQTPMYRMAAATLGGVTLAGHAVAAVPLPQQATRMDILLGYPAIRQFTWTMDFPRNRWAATLAG